jgi:hypothetical protein
LQSTCQNKAPEMCNLNILDLVLSDTFYEIKKVTLS